MTNSDGGPSEQPDLTDSNRQTYDRIARRYADHQVELASEIESPFIHLENGFAGSLPPDGVVADLGCGPAHDSIRLADKGFRVIEVDLSAGMLQVAAEQLPGRLVQGDLRAVPLAAGCVDGIWNVASMLHIPERETLAVLHEFRRVMRTSGSLVLVTALGDGSTHEPVAYASGESRWFVYRNEHSLIALLKVAGFAVQSKAVVEGSRLWLGVLATAV